MNTAQRQREPAKGWTRSEALYGYRIAESNPLPGRPGTAFAILERQQIDLVAAHLSTQARFDETALQWSTSMAVHQFKRHLRPILLAIDVAAQPAHATDRRGSLSEGYLSKGRSLDRSRPRPSPLASSRPPNGTCMSGWERAQTSPAGSLRFLVYRLLRNGPRSRRYFLPR